MKPLQYSPKKTIVQAISEAMKAEGKPMTVSEIYDAVVSSKLYSFKADQPIQVVRSQLRRHCVGLDFQSSSKAKYFVIQNGKYYLLESGKFVQHKGTNITKINKKYSRATGLVNLKNIYDQYLAELKQRILKELKNLEPKSFEIFCKNLLVVYGFDDVSITRLSKDGGIDGFGKLKLGFSHLNVAFQCKRWTKGTIGRPHINQFRGDIQGQYELGLFFTTANFSSDAENNSAKRGAVPIALFNGSAIVDIMLEKQLGVERDSLDIYTFNLELAIAENNEA